MDLFTPTLKVSDNRKEWSRQYNAWYRKTRPQELDAKVLAWKKAHPEKTKALNKASRMRLKDKCFTLFGSVCKRCGFSDARALQVDHINGAKEGRTATYRSGAKLYSAILRGDKDKTLFQLLCANCNWIKRDEAHEHNHLTKNYSNGR